MQNFDNKTFTFEEVKELLHAERRRAIDIVRSYQDDNEQSAKAQKEAGSRIYSIKENIAEECRFIGNSISELNALSATLGETSLSMIETQLKEYVNNRELSGQYAGTQTPAERLRNCLSPFLTLVNLLFENEDYVKVNINVNDDLQLREIIDRTIELCKSSKKSIKEYLSDIEEFYSNIYEFRYVEDHDSGAMTLSLHHTEKGAKMAADFHRQKELDEFNERNSSGKNTFGMTFEDYHQAWIVKKSKINQ